MLLCVAVVGTATGVPAVAAGPGQAPRSAVEFGLNRVAKILCSAVFVSGRDLEEALHNSARRVVPEAAWQRLASRSETDSGAAIVLDRAARTVGATLESYTGRAGYYGDQGCVILPPGLDQVFFEPLDVRTSLPDPTTQQWPMGDRTSGSSPAGTLDHTTAQEAVDSAFEPDGLTAALVVLHRGRIVAERYGQGASVDTQLESWSMGKSLTATLVGVLAQQGHLRLVDPAPVGLWQQDPQDPRQSITISDLMRMSSGLRFTHASQPSFEWGRGAPDHLYIYAAAIDAFDLAITRPPEFPPGSVGRYRNSDPLILGYVIRRTVESLGHSYLTWPQEALFDRIGIRQQVLETDAYGNFLLTGHDYGTARNWARLGLLYLQDGVWLGERILPAGWAEFVSTAAPAWDPSVYGGLFWVNSDGRWNVPRSAYFMSGAGGQNVIIVPSHDLVVARLGHSRGGQAGQAALNVALGKLIEAIEMLR